MVFENLTHVEQELAEQLPEPPMLGVVCTGAVWIVEWLVEPEYALRTGRRLHDWLEARQEGWSTYHRCNTAQEVLGSIEDAAYWARDTNTIPILQLEAHGSAEERQHLEGELGLVGPDGVGNLELLAWDDLIGPLQNLNEATHCNLVVFVAACSGFGGIHALTCGPRAPACVLVGPDRSVYPADLINGAKEFYRRVQDETPTLREIVDSASQEIGPAAFVAQPMVLLAFEAFAQQMIISTRPWEFCRHVDSVRQELINERKLAPGTIALRLARMQKLERKHWQMLWDEMFMLDLYPENRERFEFNMGGMVDVVFKHRPRYYDSNPD